MAADKQEFPEADAWSDNMPDINAGFNSSSVRKASGGVTAASASHDEYRKFAKLDLGNM